MGNTSGSPQRLALFASDGDYADHDHIDQHASATEPATDQDNTIGKAKAAGDEETDTGIRNEAVALCNLVQGRCAQCA